MATPKPPAPRRARAAWPYDAVPAIGCPVKLDGEIVGNVVAVHLRAEEVAEVEIELLPGAASWAGGNIHRYSIEDRS